MERAPLTRIFYFSITIVLMLMIHLILVKIACGQRQCGRWEQSLFSAENRALMSSVYKKKSTPSLVICGRDCSMDKECKSINFFKCINTCELNYDIQAEHPEDFCEDQRSVYFDSNTHTSLYSLAKTISPLKSGSCKKLLKAGFCSSGTYTIYPNGFNDGLQVYCDMETDGGGWIVFQRRQDGSVNFYQNWDEYKTGFGNLHSEFWLGNDNLFKLTSDNSQGTWELRVDLGDWDNNTAWAKYKDFKISGEQYQYTLSIGEYNVNSTAGDSLNRQNGWPFTTKDNDNDKWEGVVKNCADKFDGAWWFTDCTSSHLNGVYYPNGYYRHTQGIKWFAWLGKEIPLKQCSMKIRELNHTC